MKENHQAIARDLATQINIGYTTRDREAILAALDAAHADGDKAGYERGVRESAERFLEEASNCYWSKHNPIERKGIEQAILSLLAPPVPVWCRHCKLSDNGRVVTVCTESGDVIMQCFAFHVGQCPIAGCGAPKPETKGS